MTTPTRLRLSAVLAALLLPGPAGAQSGWGGDGDLVFHTFSIAAVDPLTGEVGVAVTTRNACVGAAVPWVRAGVGAVATQASARVEYGNELLDLLQAGVAPADALERTTAIDAQRERRQLGVIALDGRSAQYTGSETSPWAGHRAGPNYVTQGNLLVGPEVLEAVATAFEASEGAPRNLGDRLVEAVEAGHRAGGDARKGRPQSAAVVVADTRPGVSRRPDGLTVNIHVCEHAEPVAELRRIYDTVSQTLGFRTLEQQTGADVWQLKVILHALGYLGEPDQELERGPDAYVYTAAAVEAVERFRADHGLSTAASGSPAGLVDGETVARLWEELEKAGKARDVREALREVVRIRR